MKQILHALTVMTILFSSCRKNESAGTNASDPIIADAKNYFEATHFTGNADIQTNTTGKQHDPWHRSSRVMRWNDASVISIGNFKGVMVPVVMTDPTYIQTNFSRSNVYSLADLTRVFIYRDASGSFQDNVLTYFPDSSYAAGNTFTGIVFVDDWNGNTITKFKFDKGGKILQSNAKEPDASLAATESNAEQNNLLIQQTTCYTIEGYNYSPALPDERYPWSISAGCTSTYYESFEPMYPTVGISAPIAAGGFSPGAGGMTIVPVKTVVVHTGNSVIGNIADYIKCFTSNASAGYSYKVTLCVDQPVPGTRQAWGLSSASGNGTPVDVGHVFLIFTQTSPTGTITRNVGFYPGGNVTPVCPAAQGQLNNDANSTYNISLTISLTNTQFFSMLGYTSLGNNPGFYYNLNSNNCASFALATLSKGGINISSAIGTWLNGSGYDPGDLGEDIRSMTLGSNMTRNTVSNYHPNLGSCTW